MRIAVYGAGSWGTALAVHFSRSGFSVELIGRDPLKNRVMREAGENKLHLPGISFPFSLTVPDTIEAVSEETELLILAVPTPYLRASVRGINIQRVFSSDCLFLSAVKGIEKKTLKLPSSIIAEEWGESVKERLGVLSGPNFAREVALGLPAATTIASENRAVTERLIEALSVSRFRCYGNSDPLGVELSGALKNVYAIAVGIADGLKLGDNARAALITRSMAEMIRLGGCRAFGATLESFSGLAGFGDLILTCTGNQSRNRSVGLALGRGESYDAILAERGSVAEGVHTVCAVVELAKRHQVDMPIAEEVYQILYHRKSAQASLESLFSREPTHEFH